MSKIFINVIIPASGKQIELKVSPKIKVGKLTEMVKEYLKSSDFLDFIPTQEVSLCDGKKGTIYSYNASLSELDICDGHEMLLI